ncbi:MAG: hypothetical protein J1F38_01670 [Muribaculaceae bacterium]|nr:hypothetical protein [Muribaculaceae bacterium]
MINKNRKVPKIVIVPQGGIANRIRAIASAYQLSVETNKPLKVVWCANKEIKADLNDIIDTTDLPFEISKKGELLYNLTYEIPRKRNFFLSSIFQFFSKNKFIFQIGSNPSFPSEEEFLKLTTENDSDIVILSGLEFYDYDPSIIKNLFKVTKEVEKRKLEILNGNKPLLGLHIRRTDNKESIENSPLELFEEEIKKALAENKNIQFFLASDDQDVKNYLSNQYSKNIVYNPNKADRNSKEGIIDAMAELEILSGCKIILGSFYSSFSEIAAQLGAAQLKVLKKS